MKFFSSMRSLAVTTAVIGIVATLFLILYIANAVTCKGLECGLVGLAFFPAFGLGSLFAGLLLIIFIVSISIFIIRKNKNFSDGDKMEMKKKMKDISLIVFISIGVVALELFSSVNIFKLVKQIIR